MWDGSQILVIDANNKTIIDKILLPVSRPTSIALDNNNLYITSAKINERENKNYDGYLLKLYYNFNGVSEATPFYIQ